MLSDVERRHAKRQWKAADARPDWTHEQKVCAVRTGYTSAEAKQAADEQWERDALESERRERARLERAAAERRLFRRARTHGFALTRLKGQLTWKRPCAARAPSRARDRQPRRQRVASSPRRARAPGRPGEEPHPLAGATPLQLALIAFAAAMELARGLDERELDSFIEIASRRFAREAARLRWWETSL